MLYVKLIFLDIEGVLSNDYSTFASEPVAALKLLLDRTNAKVCISSAWRYNSDRREQVVSPDFGDDNRYNEILDVVELVNPSHWVVLDDLSAFDHHPDTNEDHHQIVKDHWVFVDGMSLLTKEDVEMAIEILTKRD